MTLADLQPGSQVFWRPTDGFGVSHRVPVTVIRLTAKRVIVRITLPPQGIPERHFPVSPERLFSTAT